MRVLVVEWGCAGGRNARALLPEGFGMLRTLCSALRELGHDTTALVSRTYAKEAGYLGSTELEYGSEDPIGDAGRISGEFDAACVIAPESHGILSRLSREVAQNCRLLSCPAETVDAVSNKIRASELVERTSSLLKVAPGRQVDADPGQIAAASRRIGLPCILKPTEGAGGEGSYIIRSPEDFARAGARLAASGHRSGIVQKLIQGRHHSVTFLARGSEATLLSVNTQSIVLSQGVRYAGGSCPYPFEAEDDLRRDLRRIVEESKLQGLMGLDFVYDGSAAYFMEINPRMTTSCIGLSKTVEPGLGSFIEARANSPRHTGFAQWAVMPLTKTIDAGETILQKVMEIKWVVSPPFPAGPFYMKESSKVLICVWGHDSLEMPIRVNEARKQLSEMHLTC